MTAHKDDFKNVTISIAAADQLTEDLVTAFTSDPDVSHALAAAVERLYGEIVTIEGAEVSVVRTLAAVGLGHVMEIAARRLGVI